MTRVLLDVNVVLDVLLDRAPFAEAASAVWAAVERGEAAGLLSAHAVTTLHYLNARSVGARMARDTTEALLSVFDVAPVDGGVLSSALGLGFAPRTRGGGSTRPPMKFGRSPRGRGWSRATRERTGMA